MTDRRRVSLVAPDVLGATGSQPTSRATRWRLRTRSLQFGSLPALMGIINVTPDSFSDGGRFLDPALRDRAGPAVGGRGGSDPGRRRREHKTLRFAGGCGRGTSAGHPRDQRTVRCEFRTRVDRYIESGGGCRGDRGGSGDYQRCDRIRRRSGDAAGRGWNRKRASVRCTCGARRRPCRTTRLTETSPGRFSLTCVSGGTRWWRQGSTASESAWTRGSGSARPISTT